MSKGQQKARDPVCGMEVAPGQHARVHLQMEFAFCSEQCRARFLAHPHLYIGYPGGSEISAHRPTFTFLASNTKKRGAARPFSFTSFLWPGDRPPELLIPLICLRNTSLLCRWGSHPCREQ